MPRAPLLALALLSLSACADWPNFEYAPLPDVRITEVETGTDSAQSLGYVRSRTIVNGAISGSGTRPSSLLEAGGYWYTEDVDFYAFAVEAPVDITGSLQWTEAVAGLDLIVAAYNPETMGFGEILILENVPGEISQSFEGLALDPGETYLAVIGSREGPPSPYTLTLEVNDTL